MNFGRKIPFLLNIDVEPDGRDVRGTGHRTIAGFDWLQPFLTEERRRLEDAWQSPIHFIWHLRMDPQIARAFGSLDWIARRYEAEFRSLLDAGDAIGLHPHFYRWDNAQSGWFVDDGNQVWIDEVIEQSFAAYAGAFGRPCEIYRMGDGFTNQATMNKVEAVGARFELTPEPESTPDRMEHFPERHSGSFPDCRGMPVDPYRPSLNDWKTADPHRTDGLVILPITTGDLPLEWFPEPRAAFIKKFSKRVIGRPILPRRFNVTANLSLPSRWNTHLIDAALANRQKPMVNLVVRTNAKSPERVANLEATFAYLRQHPRRQGFAFCTPPEALGQLEMSGFASAQTGT
jgi:hypothetical protein